MIVNKMKKEILFSLFCIVLSLTSCKENRLDVRTDCVNGQSQKKVLFIGLDGCRTDALLAANTPALDSLMNQAVVSLHCDRGAHTVSVPGWSTLLHGVNPDKHSLTSNSFRGNNYKRYPDLFHYINLYHSDLSLATITHWADFLRITTFEDYANFFKTDEKVKDDAIRLIENCTPDVLLLHFDDIDGAGHNKGFAPNIPEYIQSIEYNDQLTQEIMEVIYQREATLNEEWLVIVATDHGGNGTGHGGQDDLEETRFVFLIVRTPQQSRVDIPSSHNVDVMPTILEYLQIPINDDWDLDGRSLLQ